MKAAILLEIHVRKHRDVDGLPACRLYPLLYESTTDTKEIYMHTLVKAVASLSLLSLATGCSTLGASFAVSDEALVSRTETAIGVPASEFTISDRVNEGVTARYKVETKSGKRYNCFVGGSLSGIGKSVSEAVCKPLDGSGSTQPSDKNCDALSQAAGRC